MEPPRRTGYDAVVIGAGVIGLASAWRAAQRGLDVLVLERDDPGAGASGVAAGMIPPVTEADFGEQSLLELNLAGAAMWPAFAAELGERSGLDAGYFRSGALMAGPAPASSRGGAGGAPADRDGGGEPPPLSRFQRERGLDVEWLGGREARRL